MAEYVYAFLDWTADSLWQAHKRANGVRSDRDWRAFRAGVITGFEGKLSQERAGNAARGLVWVGDPELREHYRRRHPRLVTRTSGGYGDWDAREREGGRAERRYLTPGRGRVGVQRAEVGGTGGSSGVPAWRVPSCRRPVALRSDRTSVVPTRFVVAGIGLGSSEGGIATAEAVFCGFKLP